MPHDCGGTIDARRSLLSLNRTCQLASKTANQPVRIPSACALDLLCFDVGYRKNLRRIVHELAETIFGGALSRAQRPISSLCRNSCSAPFSSLTDMRFPFELSWSHRLLVDAGTITLLQETLPLFWHHLRNGFSRNLRFLAASSPTETHSDPLLATSSVEIANNQGVGCVTAGIALAMGHTSCLQVPRCDSSCREEGRFRGRPSESVSGVGACRESSWTRLNNYRESHDAFEAFRPRGKPHK